MCGSAAYQWEVLSGRGVLYSYVVDYRLLVPGFNQPYVIGQIVPLESATDTVRIVGNIRDCSVKDVAIGMDLEVFFERVGETTLPQFRPTTASRLAAGS
jgi:hypothetical protein